MNCGDINELSPLWHSGELEASQRKEFDEHVGGCPDCAEELHGQRSSDRRLREAIVAEPADTGDLERRFMHSIARERQRRWLVSGIAAAAALIAAVAVWTTRHAPLNPALLADAARDHTVEVIKQAPRRWRTNPVEIAALESSQGIADSDVRKLEAIGYLLERAKICRLAGTPYMHLVYAKGGHEFSVFMKVRGKQTIPETASTSGNLQLAAFSGGRVQAVIATDASRGECAKFAHDAAAAL